jgi:cytoskeletal protein RodZ
MYGWIWQKLPFGLWGKLVGSFALIAATGVLLWYVVFPWATPLLPFDDVQVGSDTQQGPAQEDPNAVSSDDGPDEIPYSTRSNAPDPSATAVPKSTRTPKGIRSTSAVLPGD